MTLPVLVTTSHNSGDIPFAVLAEMLGDRVYQPDVRADLVKHLFDQSDPYTEAIFYLPGARHIQATTSRFVVDLNRAREQRGPNGVIKMTDFDQRPLYPVGFSLTPEEEEDRLEQYWDPYHRAVSRALASSEVRFLLDGHAMTSTGPALSPDGGRRRPAFSLITGGDRSGNPREAGSHTGIPASLAHEVVELLAHHFGDLIRASEVPDEILINDPFPIGGIQNLHSDPQGPSRTPSFGLEINRGLYLRRGPDGHDQEIPGRIEKLNARLRSFITELVPRVEALVARNRQR